MRHHASDGARCFNLFSVLVISAGALIGSGGESTGASSEHSEPVPVRFELADRLQVGREIGFGENRGFRIGRSYITYGSQSGKQKQTNRAHTGHNLLT